MHLGAKEAHDLATGILRKQGFDAEDAALISDVLVEAHLWGRPASGLNHLRAIVTSAGARQPIAVVEESSRSVLIDGGNNPGFLVAPRAMLLAIAKAKEIGMATAAVRNAYLGGINGYYVNMAAQRDLIGIATTASGRRVAPAGSIDPLLGTNPIAVAIPTLAQPIILDMATASTNVGGLHRAERLNETLAPGLAVGPDGAPTVDPSRALEGAILPFGGHKGSGLAMIVQCLGLLAGGPIMPQGIKNFGYFFLAIDPSLFMPVEDYKARTSELVDVVRASRSAGADPVRVPGERSLRERDRRLVEGFDIDHQLYEELMELAERTWAD